MSDKTSVDYDALRAQDVADFGEEAGKQFDNSMNAAGIIDGGDWTSALGSGVDLASTWLTDATKDFDTKSDDPVWSADDEDFRAGLIPKGFIAAPTRNEAKPGQSFWSSILGQKSDTVQAKIIESLLAGIGGLSKGKRESRALDLKQEEVRIAADAQALKDKQISNAMTSAGNLNVGILGRQPVYDASLYKNTMSNRQPMRLS